MSYSKLTYTAVLGQQTYNVTFSALQKEHIKATVDGTPVTTFVVSSGYAAGSATITFSAPTFAGGEEIVISRETGTTRLVDYQAGVPLTEAALDLDSKQPLYLNEEVADNYQALSEKGVANGYASLDASGLVPRSELGTGSALATTFLAGDGSWKPVSGSGGSGDVTSPGAGTVAEDELALFGNADGTVLKGSGIDVSTVLVDGDIGTTVAALSGGLVPPTQLGTGTDITSKYLKGDGTWATPAGGGTGNVSSSGIINSDELAQFVDANTIESSGVALTDLVQQSEKGTTIATLSGGLVPVAQLGTGTPAADTYLTGIGTWATITTGTGDASTSIGTTVDNRVARFDGATGKLLHDSPVVISDAGDITGVNLVDGRDVSTDGAKLDTITVANIPSAGQKSALVGTEGTPGGTNPYVTSDDLRLDTFGPDNGVTPGTEGIVPAPQVGDLNLNKYLGVDGWKKVNASHLDGVLGTTAGGTAAANYNDGFSNLAPQVPLGEYPGALLVRNASPLPVLSGGRWVHLAPGTDGHYLKCNSAASNGLGVEWDGIAGGGDVSGVGLSTTGHVAIYSDGTGKAIQDSGVPYGNLLQDSDVVYTGGTPNGVLGTLGGTPNPADLGTSHPGAVTTHYLAADGSWVVLPTAGTGDVTGPAGGTSTNEVVVFTDASGKDIGPSSVAVGDIILDSDRNTAGGFPGLDSEEGRVKPSTLVPYQWAKHQYTMQAVPNALSYRSIGWGLDLLSSGWEGENSDTSGYYRRHTTGGVTSPEPAGLVAPSFAYVNTSWQPELTVKIKTPSDLTNVRIWIGFGSRVFWNETTPDNGFVAAFRYINGTDTNWTTYTANTSGTQVDSSAFGGAMGAGTTYLLRVSLSASGNATFWRSLDDGETWIKGATVHSIAALGSNRYLGLACVLTTSTTAVRYLDISRLYLEHK